MLIGDEDREDLGVGMFHIKNTSSSKYLEVKLIARVKSAGDISNKKARNTGKLT